MEDAVDDNVDDQEAEFQFMLGLIQAFLIFFRLFL